MFQEPIARLSDIYSSNLTLCKTYFARGALLNSIFLCVPSQNGFFSDWPHRQREKVFPTLYASPLPSTNSTFPFTRIEPLSLILITTFSCSK